MSEPLDTALLHAPAVPSVERERVHSRLMARMFARPLEPFRIGRFEIISRVGGGGQGDVYRARDPTLGRVVAVKVLRSAAAATSKEARMLARLAHPNVVAVFARGEHRTRSGHRCGYLVTEFVEGTSLTDWLETDPGPRERLAVLEGCARGLLAAHRGGVVHGDFKPSNVMIERDRRARIIDFGISDEVDDTRTARNGVQGTTGYLAPERYAGQVGPPNDQFALCRVATEALSQHGCSRRLREALRRGCAEDPRERFDSLDPLVRAFESEVRPRRRWGVRAAIVALPLVLGMSGTLPVGARDVDRCEGVSALAQELWMRADRAALRASPGGGPVLALGDAWSAQWDEQRQAACRLGEDAAPAVRCLHGLLAEFELRVGLAGERGGGRLVESLASLPSADSCASADPTLHPGGPGSTVQEDVLRRAWLAQDLDDPAGALALTETMAAELERLPDALAARVLWSRGAAARDLGRLEDAEAWLEAAVWRAERAGADTIQAQAATGLALALGQARGDLVRAQPWLRRAELAAARSATKADDRRVLRAQAWHASALGEFARARALLARSQHQASGLEYAHSLRQSCQLEERAGRPAEAIVRCEAAIEAYDEVLGPRHPSTLAQRQSLGAALEGVGRYAEAKAVLEQTLAAMRQAGAGGTIGTLNSLAIVLEQLGEFGAARRAYEEALQELDAQPGHGPEYRETIELNLGSLALAQGDGVTAETRFQRSLIAIESRLGPDSPRAMNARWGLAGALEAQGRYADALLEIDEALRIGELNDLGPVSLAKPRLVRARVLIEGNLDVVAGRASARRALADVEAYAPDLVETAAEARALAFSTPG